MNKWVVFVCVCAVLEKCSAKLTAWAGKMWINSIRWFILWNESGNLWPFLDKWKRGTCDLWHKRGNYPVLFQWTGFFYASPNSQHQLSISLHSPYYINPPGHRVTNIHTYIHTYYRNEHYNPQPLHRPCIELFSHF